MNRLSLILAVFLLGAFSLVAQQPSQQNTSGQDTRPVVRSTAQEVVLDVVFRDKKGRTIRDIRPEEIHVFEDGVEQKLTSFRLVEGSAPSNTTSTASGSSESLTLDPMRQLRLVTLVFEGLDQDGKRFFRQALKDILDMSPEKNLYYSILTVDHGLHIVQPFTTNHTALLRSMDKSMTWSFLQYEKQSAEVKQALQQLLSEGEPQLQGGIGGGPNQSQVQDFVNYRMARIQYDMLTQAETADRAYNARSTLDALSALVRSQSQFPGRKGILYFNPWLFIPETVKEQYANLISVANRANVSFYTVDPKGLVTWSQNNTGRDALNYAAGETRAQQMRGGIGEVTAAQARAGETAEGALRANPLLWLRDLAQQTGGVTIAETNDYRAPLRTALEEVRTYYEASYAPHITVFDGKFRKISARVDRPDVVVHARSGYFALPHIKGGQQLFAYEMPLLNALNAASPPLDVAFQAAAERFNDHGLKVEYMVTLEAPLKGLTFAPQADQKNSAVDAALIAVLKNANGEIVEKFSKDFAVQVALDKVDAFKAGNLVQTFRTELPPGEYALEAAVMDRNGSKIGVTKSTLTVQPPSSKLSMSDVVVIRRTDPMKDGNPAPDAFYFPGGKVVPTLARALKGGPGNVLPFYFAVYPDRANKDALKLTMSFYKGGQYLGAAEAPLPDVQQDGRIPYIANLPADKFAPGAYEIHIGVTQGSSKAEEKVTVQVN